MYCIMILNLYKYDREKTQSRKTLPIPINLSLIPNNV